MEYIDIKPILSGTVQEQVAKALQWLRRVPAPPDVVIGPLGGGLAHHQLLKDYVAPQ